VPEYEGLSYAEVGTAIAKAKLTVVTVGKPGESEGKVVGATPAPGTVMTPGSTVVLVVGEPTYTPTPTPTSVPPTPTRTPTATPTSVPPTSTHTPTPTPTPTRRPGSEIGDFVGEWVNVETNAGPFGLTKVVVQRVSDSTLLVAVDNYLLVPRLRFPAGLSWVETPLGTVKVPFTPSTLAVTYDSETFERTIALARDGQQMVAEVHYDYTPESGQEDTTQTYRLKRAKTFRPSDMILVTIPAPAQPVIPFKITALPQNIVTVTPRQP
jgi:hypothetical protein